MDDSEIRQYTVIDPALKEVKDPIWRYLYVMCDDNDVASLMDLKRYGVDVRLSTDEEVKHIWALEVEMDYDDPDATMKWPEQEAEIRLTVKDW